MPRNKTPTPVDRDAITETVLVLVHPGSACGSADFNLGAGPAENARWLIADDLLNWRGPVAVVDGFLSDEIPRYPTLRDAIREALAQAGDRGVRVKACDSLGHTHLAAGRVVRKMRLDPSVTAIALTGAWHDPEGGDGCVTDVHRGFTRLGFKADVLSSAARLDDDPEEDHDGSVPGARP